MYRTYIMNFLSGLVNAVTRIGQNVFNTSRDMLSYLGIISPPQNPMDQLNDLVLNPRRPAFLSEIEIANGVPFIRNGQVLEIKIKFFVYGRNGLLQSREYKHSEIWNGGRVPLNAELREQLFRDLIRKIEQSEIKISNIVDDSHELISISVVPQNTTGNAVVNASKYSFPFTQPIIVPQSMKGGSQCAKLGILSQLFDKVNFKTYKLQDLEREMTNLGVDHNRITPNDIYKWVVTCHPKTISLHMFNIAWINIPNGEHIADEATVSLMLVARDSHVEFVVDPKFRSLITYNHDVAKDYKKIEQTVPVFVSKNDELMILDLIDGKINSTVVTDADLDDIADKISKKTNFLTFVNLNHEISVDCYVHPVTQKAIYMNEDYKVLKKAHEIAYKQFPYETFTYEKQSYTSFAKCLFEVICGGLPEESYQVREDHEINNKFNTKAFVTSVVEDPFFLNDQEILPIHGRLEAIDITKCYPNCVLDMEYDYPIYISANHWLKHDGKTLKFSECIFNKNIQLVDGLVIENEIVPKNLFDYLLKEKFVTVSDIGYVRTATYTTSCEYLKIFINETRKLFGVTGWELEKTDMTVACKKIHNFFIGHFGIKSKKDKRGFVCTEEDTVSRIVYDCLNAGKAVSTKVRKIGDLYYVNAESSIPKYENSTAINRQIIAQSKIAILELIKKVKAISPHSQLIYVKTDCAGFYTPESPKCLLDWHRPDEHIDIATRLNNPLYRKVAFEPVKYKVGQKERLVPHLFENPETETLLDFKFVTDKKYYLIDGVKASDEKGKTYENELKTKSMIVKGGPGAGKSFLAAHLSDKTTKIYVGTNKACTELENKLGKNIAKPKTLDIEIVNFGSLNLAIKGGKAKHIVVDEVFRIKEIHLRKLYELKQENPHLVFHGFGDPGQLPAIESSGVQFNWDDKPLFKYVFGNRVMNALNIEGVSRFDNPLKDVLDVFDKTGRIPNSFKPVDLGLENNLCMFKNEKEGHISVNSLNKAKLMKNSEHFIVGESVMSNVNKKGLCNSQLYTIKSFKKKDANYEYELNEITGTFESKCFEGGSNITVDRGQGITIKTPYNIHDIEKMSFEKLRVALTRATKKEHIHLNWVNKKWLPIKYEQNLPKSLPLNEIDVATIYCLENSATKEMYIHWCIGKFTFPSELKNPENWNKKELCQTIFVNTSLVQHRLLDDIIPPQVRYVLQKYVMKAHENCKGFKLLNDTCKNRRTIKVETPNLVGSKEFDPLKVIKPSKSSKSTYQKKQELAKTHLEACKGKTYIMPKIVPRKIETPT